MSDQTRILEMAKQSRFFDERLLSDDVLAMAKHGPKCITIQPSTVPGFAHVSVVDFQTNTSESTGKPIRRDAIALFLDSILPGFVNQIEWRVSTTEERWLHGITSSEFISRIRNQLAFNVPWKVIANAEGMTVANCRAALGLPEYSQEPSEPAPRKQRQRDLFNQPERSEVSDR
jgi:hypothetical protein